MEAVLKREVDAIRLAHALDLIPEFQELRVRIESVRGDDALKEATDQLRTLSGYAASVIDTDAKTLSRYMEVSPSGFSKFLNGSIPRKKSALTVTSGLLRSLQDFSEECQNRAIEPLYETRWIEKKELASADLIRRLSDTLAKLIEKVNALNTPSEDSAINDLERTQLISLLKRALEILQSSPQVEVGTLRKIKNNLSRSAKKSVEKQVDTAFGEAARQGIDLIEETIKGIL